MCAASVRASQSRRCAIATRRAPRAPAAHSPAGMLSLPYFAQRWAGRFAPDVARIDAQRLADDSLDHETPLAEVFEDQIACADIVLLTKPDLAGPAGVARAKAIIAAEAPRPLPVIEVAEGVIEPTRLKEGSAALSLLWSMRAKRFWTTVADGFADQESSETSTDFGIRAYENELEPYHAFIFKNTFRTGLRALPSRKEMLGKMALMPSASMGLDTCWEGWEASAEAGEDLTPDERMAACLVELRECSDATKRVTNIVQAVLDDLELRDDRKL